VRGTAILTRVWSSDRLIHPRFSATLSGITSCSVAQNKKNQVTPSSDTQLSYLEKATANKALTTVVSDVLWLY
jgi:hypothetical protein